MERLQNPFSVYDFLGYLIPGALAVYAGLIIFSTNDVGWSKVFKSYGLNRPVMIFPLTIGSYVAGHIVSYLSSVSLEKYSVWSMGFPSKYLLGIKHSGYWGSTAKGMVSGWEKFVRRLSRFIMAIILLPISILDFLFGLVFYGRYLYSRKLDDFTKEVILNHLNLSWYGLTGIKDPEKSGDITDQNFFNVIYHYCLERATHHQSKFQNYIALYGFLRALSFLFVLLFWSFLITNSFTGVLYETVLLGITAFILYMAYNKFSRRFTLEVLMAYVTLTKSDLSTTQYSGNAPVFSKWSGEDEGFEYTYE